MIIMAARYVVRNGWTGNDSDESDARFGAFFLAAVDERGGLAFCWGREGVEVRSSMRAGRARSIFRVHGAEE
jgi:hypothetical protein